MNSSLTPASNSPRSPKVGAFLRRKDHNSERSFETFVRWIDQVTIATNKQDSVLAEEYDALTAAYYHHTYDRATAVTGANLGRLVSIESYRGISPVIRRDGAFSMAVWNANTVAALAPLLNPTFESIEDKVVRLERERDDIEAGIYSRMIAEGMARDWCTEFDGILDSTGLPPRKPKGKIIGTLTFTMESDNIESHRATIEASPNGWVNVISTNLITLVPDSITVEAPLAVSRYS